MLRILYEKGMTYLGKAPLLLGDAFGTHILRNGLSWESVRSLVVPR